MSNSKSSRTIVLFMLITAWEMVFANFAHPITPTLIQNLKLPAYTFGAAYAAMSFTSFLFSPFWGTLSDRIGRVKIYVLCMFGYAFGQYLFSQATQEIHILIARSVAGFFIGGINVFQTAYLLDIVEPHERGKYLSIETALISITAALGYLGGGLIGEISISLVFTLMILGLALNGVAAWFLLKDVIVPERDRRVRDLLRISNPFSAFKQVFGRLDKTLILFFATVLLYSIGNIATEQSFNYFLRDQLGFGSSVNGLLKAGFGILGPIVNTTLSLRLARQSRLNKPILALLTGSSLMAFLLLFTQSSVSFIGVSIVFFTQTTILAVLLRIHASRHTPKGEEGVFMGFYSSIMAMGSIFGALSAGFVYGLGPRNAFLLSAVALILGVLIYGSQKDKVHV